MQRQKLITPGKLDASGLICGRTCVIGGVLLFTNGIADASIVVYDNTEGSGKQVYELTVLGASKQGGMIWPIVVPLENGMYITISGAGAYFYVYYNLG